MPGSMVRIDCRSSTDVSWFLNGKRLHNNTDIFPAKPGADVHALVLYSVKKFNSGMYVCYGKDFHDDRYLKFYSTATLQIVGKYKVLTC